MSQELSVPGDSARCLHLLTSGPVTDLSTPPRMENPQIPFSYEFPEAREGGTPGQAERKIHGQLQSFSVKRQLGGKEPDISHSNLALQPW